MASPGMSVWVRLHSCMHCRRHYNTKQKYALSRPCAIMVQTCAGLPAAHAVTRKIMLMRNACLQPWKPHFSV